MPVYTYVPQSLLSLGYICISNMNGLSVLICRAGTKECPTKMHCPASEHCMQFITSLGLDRNEYFQ